MEKDSIVTIHSLTPREAAGNALTDEFKIIVVMAMLRPFIEAVGKTL